MERKLASIQVIGALEPIEGADRILAATVMGWNVVVKKDEFRVGDKAIFLEIDAQAPEAEWSEFLRPRKFRVKTCKLRGVLSQGLALPTYILPGSENFDVGTDVTESLGVTKHEPPIHDGGAKMGCAAGSFPSAIPKTDEIRLQSALGVIDELKAAGPFYISVKVDGTSATFCFDQDEFCACSRNWKKRDGENIYWEMARKYGLESVLSGTDLAVQGEIAGPGIQKNKLCLNEIDLFVFGIFDIKRGRRLGLHDLVDFCEGHGLRHVPIERVVDGEEELAVFDHSLAAWIERAKGMYEGTQNFREGVVVRTVDPTYSPTLRSGLSFKVLSNDFLLKYDSR